MVDYREILRLHDLGRSQRGIALEVQSSRDTVAATITAAKAAGVSWPLDDEVSNADIQEILFPGKYTMASPYTVPDYEWIHRELARMGVTLTLLWSEYCVKVRDTGGVPYMYTQFCEKYRRWARVTKATMRITHKPGDAIQVDWAGDPLYITDPVTGEEDPAYIFVAVLPCSWKTYAEPCSDMKSENWLLCHVHAYNYYGGVPRLLIPDNTKTATIQNNRYETILNKSYQEMADHYGTAIVPARVKKPDDYRRKKVIGNLSLNSCSYEELQAEMICFFPIIVQARPQKWRRYSSLPFHFFSGMDLTLPSSSLTGSAS